jgi:hypothetical protein
MPELMQQCVVLTLCWVSVRVFLYVSHNGVHRILKLIVSDLHILLLQRLLLWQVIVNTLLQTFYIYVSEEVGAF